MKEIGPDSELEIVKRHYVEAMAILESIEVVLDGGEPSDFMLSFPTVRRVYESAKGYILP